MREAALEALCVLQAEPIRVSALRSCAAALADAVGTGAPAGGVLSVPVASPAHAVAGAAQLLDHGIRVGCFRPPSVPDGRSRLRITASAALSGADLQRATDTLRSVLGPVPER